MADITLDEGESKVRIVGPDIDTFDCHVVCLTFDGEDVQVELFLRDRWLKSHVTEASVGKFSIKATTAKRKR